MINKRDGYTKQTALLQSFTVGELVWVLKLVGSAKLGYRTLRYEGQVIRLLRTRLMVKWVDQNKRVHFDRLPLKRVERRTGNKVSRANLPVEPKYTGFLAWLEGVEA